MPCACSSRKKIKYVNPQIHPLPTIGSHILAQKRNHQLELDTQPFKK